MMGLLESGVSGDHIAETHLVIPSYTRPLRWGYSDPPMKESRPRPPPYTALAQPCLDQMIGSEVWVKRDDMSSGAAAGNKIRKLEYLLGRGLSSGRRRPFSPAVAFSRTTPGPPQLRLAS